VRNKFLLYKSIVLGALCFPSPFLIFFYFYDIVPDTFLERFYMIMFLILSGAIVGLVGYYKDSTIEAMKDWFPSERGMGNRGN
jgi:hypothetical protein